MLAVKQRISHMRVVTQRYEHSTDEEVRLGDLSLVENCAGDRNAVRL